MSVYDGTIGEQEYRHGRDNGRMTAEALGEQGLAVWMHDDDETAAREDLATAQSYRTRAYFLGWLRGFREVSR